MNPGGDTRVVAATGLAHRYGDDQALKTLDLAIPAGCMAGLIGPDGVGKSTLLSLIAGARQMQDGGLRVLDGDMRDEGFRARVSPRIAYMPQGLGKNLYPSLSVFENLDFFARLFGQRREERERRIRELLKATGLSPFAERPAAKLSGGMKQKLGLCCALIHDPDLLILDEPTTGVDPLSRRQFWELIARIRRRRAGMSVLVATAYMEEAERFDWLAAMDDGRILGTGTPAELKASTGSDSLEAAFVALLPEARRRGHHQLDVPPRTHQGDGPAISADGLSKRFGHFTAVDRVSLDIERGEIFGFLGSNGCGKTTTMKMLTGLLPPSEGEARLFGHPVDARDLSTRRRVGYMSQAFSLYTELSVQQNLELHARLFHLPEADIPARIEELVQRFSLQEFRDDLPEGLPLGIRQRLSLAVAVVHAPEILILDEPTSGVDPVARDNFWALLIELSREQGVTIFISTHFMDEAARCDRISLMHAGRVLATDSPQALCRARGSDSLEDAFIAYLADAQGGLADDTGEEDALPPASGEQPRPPHLGFSLMRLLGYAHREGLELLRDPIRLTFALLGSVILMFILGFGISMDVEDLRFAVLDMDRTPQSRDYIQNISGSRYFLQQRDIRDREELEQRMREGDLSLAIEIPPGFGRQLKRERTPEVAVWIDGAMPFRGETIRGYVQGMHQSYLTDLSLRTTGVIASAVPADMVSRYSYNQSFESLDAMVPAVIPLLLVFIPAILMALGVVREKELGSIINLYVTPTTRLEFLLGKQLPYVAVSMFSFFALVVLAVFVFDVPLKGSLPALSAAALLYVIATTGVGLLMSAFTRTQIAALAGTAVLTLMVATNFCGMTHPLSSLEGLGAVIGRIFPTTYFLTASRGVFAKGLEFADLYPQMLALAAFIPVLTLASALSLRKQDR